MENAPLVGGATKPLTVGREPKMLTRNQAGLDRGPTKEKAASLENVLFVTSLGIEQVNVLRRRKSKVKMRT